MVDFESDSRFQAGSLGATASLPSRQLIMSGVATFLADDACAFDDASAFGRGSESLASGR